MERKKFLRALFSGSEATFYEINGNQCAWQPVSMAQQKRDEKINENIKDPGFTNRPALAAFFPTSFCYRQVASQILGNTIIISPT
jgi:hypothetical protein